MKLQQRLFTRMYKKAPSAESLAWHRDDPVPLLTKAVAGHPSGGRALDLGCGTGLDAVYLAQQGYEVTAVDFVADALAATQERAASAGVSVDCREGDVINVNVSGPFDIVLDSGCLHHIPKNNIAAYRERIDEWLGPSSDYVLVHFAHRSRIPVPKGPNHLDRAQATALFAPLELKDYDELFYDVPLPMGKMRAGVYWFQNTRR